MATAVIQNPGSILEKRLQKGERHFTLNEAAAATGLFIDDARRALEQLIQKYVCRLQVTENGDLIYDFGKTLQRRGEKTWAERRAEIAAALWRVFTVIYKAWIAVTLVVYFVLFLLILVALVLAMSSRKNGKDRGPSLDFLGDLFTSIFRWRTHTDTVLYRTDRRGYRYRHYAPTPSPINQNKKSFIASVYDFVFGPARVTIDPLQNHKEVAAYLRRQKGIVVATELCALAGWNFAQAETFLTDCLVRFQGEVKVSENGVLYGEFNDLLRGVGGTQEAQIIYYWDEYEPEYQLAGNTPGRNLAIVLMNGFNLAFSFYLLNHLLPRLLQSRLPEEILPGLGSWIATHATSAYLLLGWLPLIFSLLFFIIPLARWFKLQSARRRRHHNNIRKRLFKAIFQQQGKPQTARAIHQAVNDNAREEKLSPTTVERGLHEIVLDFPGETLVSPEGEMLYAFPRVARELAEVVHLRDQRRLEAGLGKVIMDSDN
ncbi:MAG: hypothetical protein ONB48_06035 [candidate division KSB1 bacterium]|nr:hypothetical protein [candidate division KSB1 bacterium]MDZ7273106.1 hypothetical protein [candidate division KSB1 bacterium]MDZ7285208.1 hypothetical protein [candidate division KSB1 bacterium]MDZ7298240.1 hypothetical protein [candidate division KSB1 bacterium]MDZ7309190.1 hypothetical protein [candidate division KSB1 bacterium]